MWPFKNGKPTPPPDVTRDGITSRYNTALECWEFEFQDIQFQVSGVPMNEAAFGWSREAAAIIQSLRVEIDSKAQNLLGEGLYDWTASRINSVDLDDYESSRKIGILISGDDTWGDLCVSITIAEEKIVDAYVFD